VSSIHCILYDTHHLHTTPYMDNTTQCAPNTLHHKLPISIVTITHALWNVLLTPNSAHSVLYTLQATPCPTNCAPLPIKRTVHNTPESIHSTLCTIPYTLHLHSTSYIVHYTLCAIPNTLNTIDYRCAVRNTFYTAHCIHSALYNPHSAHCTHSTLDTLVSYSTTQYIIQYTPYTLQYALHTIHHTLYMYTTCTSYT
jgi:hypothetical protein